jgi:hypothetical protein
MFQCLLHGRGWKRGASWAFQTAPAHAIRPEAADLLMPERLRPGQPRMRDIEDASFETVSRTDAASRPRKGSKGGVFKSRMTDSRCRRWPVSARFCIRASSGSGRAARRVRRQQAPAMSATRPSARIAFAVQWSVRSWPGRVLDGRWSCTGRPPGGGEPLALTVARTQPIDALNARGVLSPRSGGHVFCSGGEPVHAESGSIIHALPRPARIERAGSILMIRPEGG